MITIRDIARLAGLDDKGRLEDVVTRIVLAARGHAVEQPSDFYGPVADVLGVSRDLLINSRCPRALSGRWAVWSALSAAGWSANGIALRSCPDRAWDHSTVRSALRRSEELAAPQREWYLLALASAQRALRARSEVLSAVKSAVH